MNKTRLGSLQLRDMFHVVDEDCTVVVPDLSLEMKKGVDCGWKMRVQTVGARPKQGGVGYMYTSC